MFGWLVAAGWQGFSCSLGIFAASYPVIRPVKIDKGCERSWSYEAGVREALWGPEGLPQEGGWVRGQHEVLAMELLLCAELGLLAGAVQGMFLGKLVLLRDSLFESPTTFSLALLAFQPKRGLDVLSSSVELVFPASQRCRVLLLFS